MDLGLGLLALRSRLSGQKPQGADPLLLYGEGGFLRGVHPPQHKDMAARPIRRLAFPPRVVVPLSQHVGRPAVAIVRPGQEVQRGEPIARADGPVSVPMHAPVTGRVESVGLHASAGGPWVESIVIKTHEAATQEVLWRAPRELDALDRAGLIEAVAETGMVGLGGAAFPTHAKLRVPAEYPLEAMLVNGCECEPYLSADHRIMLERTEALLRGVGLVRRAVGAPRAIIGIEDNKPDAIAAVRARLPADGTVTVRPVPTKYPQGAGEMLIKALLGRELPPGWRSYQVGAFVQNVATLAELGRLLPAGEGFVERVVTVAGTAVRRPGNYLVPLGTPLRFVLEQAGVADEALEVVLGGPMMGQAISSLEVPVTKAVAGILAFRARDLAAGRGGRTTPCIKCGECVAACPMGLNPSLLGLLAGRREYDAMAAHHLGACFECGSCSFVCPANLPLVQRFRIAKQVLRERAA